MGVENVGGGGNAYAHAGLQGHQRDGEPEGPGRRGDRGDAGGPQSTDDGGGDGARTGDGWRTGGNNPASSGNEGNQGTRGRNGNAYGNNGNPGNSGNQGNGAMNTGGRAPAGLIDAPGYVHQLGNSLFSAASAAQGLRHGGDGPGMQRSSAASSNAQPPAGGTPASAGAGAMQAPLVARAATANAFAAPGNQAAGGAAGAGMVATTSSTMTGQAAAMSQRATADATVLLPGQAGRPVAEAAMQARPDAAALAAARASAAAPGAVPAAPGAPLPVAPGNPAAPAGNPQALAAAGLTVATVSIIPPGDARGVVLPAHDAVHSQRAEHLKPAGHTIVGGQRRGLRSRLSGAMPEGRLERLLWAMG